MSISLFNRKSTNRTPGVGAYRTDEGKPFILPSVKQAIKLIDEANLDNEYGKLFLFFVELEID